MIDVHCHIDQYPDPHSILEICERAKITTISMTNLPSHFEMGYQHVVPYKRIRLSLGMHPLYAEVHANEFFLFLNNLPKTSYIGEIGLDFSRDGIATKELQIDSFNKILKELLGKKKILSLHSRQAEKEVLRFLIEYKIQNAVFHWYTGPIKLIDEIVKEGYYFSINSAMIASKNGQKIIDRIPLDKILTESDGPYISDKGKIETPQSISKVIKYLAQRWSKTPDEVEAIIDRNFKKIITNII